MKRISSRRARALLAAAGSAGILAWATAGGASRSRSQAPSTTPFAVEEATIADVHRAFEARRLTCVQLVQRYLERIRAYEQTRPMRKPSPLLPPVGARARSNPAREEMRP